VSEAIAEDHAGGKEGPGVIESLLGGIIFTLVLVVFVPVICEHFIQSYVEQFIGSTTFLGITSNALISFAMWTIIMGFTMLLGGGGILRKYGVAGIVGLIVAYFLLDNPRGAVIPVITLCIVYSVFFILTKVRHRDGCEYK
jgi:hypothetical protein